MAQSHRAHRARRKAGGHPGADAGRAAAIPREPVGQPPRQSRSAPHSEAVPPPLARRRRGAAHAGAIQRRPAPAHVDRQLRSAHRLRESRQPYARALGHPAPADRCPHRAWRFTHSAGAACARRMRAARFARGRRRLGRCLGRSKANSASRLPERPRQYQREPFPGRHGICLCRVACSPACFSALRLHGSLRTPIPSRLYAAPIVPPGRHTTFAQKGLVVAQAAVSVVLLCAAGFLILSLQKLEHRHFGFDVTHRTIVQINAQTAGLAARSTRQLLSPARRIALLHPGRLACRVVHVEPDGRRQPQRRCLRRRPARATGRLEREFVLLGSREPGLFHNHRNQGAAGPRVFR